MAGVIFVQDQRFYHWGNMGSPLEKPHQARSVVRRVDLCVNLIVQASFQIGLDRFAGAYEGCQFSQSQIFDNGIPDLPREVHERDPLLDIVISL